MRKKGLGFICIGHYGKFYFFDKDTKKIVSAQNMGKAEYLPNRAIRLKKKFPLKQTTREELIIKIRSGDKLSAQKS